MTDKKPPVMVEIICADSHAHNSTETTVVQVDRDLWDRMSWNERAAHCDQMADEDAYNRFSWGWHIHDPADRASTEEPK